MDKGLTKLHHRGTEHAERNAEPGLGLCSTDEPVHERERQYHNDVRRYVIPRAF